MRDITIIQWALAIMLVLNGLMVALTLGTKALRSSRKRRNESRTRRLETLLDDSLANMEVHPELRRLGGRDLDLLAALMIEYLSVLSGAQRAWLAQLAEEAGLVRRYSGRLHSRSWWRKARAAQNLGHLGGPETVASLAELLTHPQETLRAVVARALARLGTPEAAAALAETLNDPSELTRLRMAENLERIGALAIEPLVETLKNGNPQAQVLAARVLGNLRAAEAGPNLCEAMLEGSTADLRAQAALALGKTGNPENVPILLKASEDEAWPVRAQVANALKMIGEVSTIPTLQKLTVDREWWVRLNASRALANMGPAGERALARVLEGEDRFARDWAAATLEERGITRRAVGELTTPGEKGESARAMIRAMVRAGAVRYLNRLARTLPDESARGALRQLLTEAHEP
jgi:HEAT repeat protein